MLRSHGAQLLGLNTACALPGERFKHHYRYFLAFILLCALFPDLSYGAASLQPFTQPQDQSLHYLQIIFGRVGDVLQGRDKILGSLFNILNSAILFLSCIVLSYVTIVSLINTAQEGHIMGNKGWSPMWIVLRSVMGIAIVAPGVTGYSLIQEFMMTIVLEGVGAANGIWQSGLKVVQRAGSLNQYQLDKSDVPETIGLDSLIEDLFKAAVCRAKLHNDFKQRQADINSGNVVATDLPLEYFNPDIRPILRPDETNASYFFVGNTYTKQNETALTDNELCGTVYAPTSVSIQSVQGVPASVINLTPEQKLIHLQAAIAALEYLAPFAESIYNQEYPTFSKPALQNAGKIYDNAIAVTRTSLGPSGVTPGVTLNVNSTGISSSTQSGLNIASSITVGSSGLGNAVNSTVSGVNQGASYIDYGVQESIAFFKDTGDSLSGIKKEVFQNAIADGWLFAGSYYYKLVKPMPILYPLPASSFTAPVWPDYTNSKDHTVTNFSFMNDEPYKTMIPDYINQQNQYAASAGQANTTMASINTTSFPKKGGLQKVWDKTIGAVSKKLTTAIVKNLTNKSSDPINSLQQWGDGLLMAAEAIWLASIPLVVVAMVATGGVPYNPLTNALKIANKILFPIMIALMSLLWSMGAMLAIYVPLIPYILFTMGAMAWLIMVIEAMVAIPLVALGIVAPSKDKFESIEPAMKIILGVFLRPGLMVIGFFAGSRLLVAAVDMINFGFLTTLSGAVPSFSMFAVFPVVMIYTGLILAVINKCFSLIHILPDKILRWIGGVQESIGSTASQDAQSVKGYAEKGVAAGDAVAGAGIKFAQTKIGERETRSKEKDAAEKAKNLEIKKMEKKEEKEAKKAAKKAAKNQDPNNP